MSQEPDPPQQTTPQKMFFFHQGSPGDSGSSGGSSQDEGGSPAPIPARLLPREPRAAPRPSMHPVPGAGGAPFAGGAAGYYAAVPAPPPFELPREPPPRRRPAPAGGMSGAPAPADARSGGAGQPATSAYPSGGWQAGPIIHAAGSGLPGPSTFSGALGQPAYPVYAQSPPPPQQHAGQGGPVRAAQGRPLQANPIVVPRAETNELCQYCGRYFPVSQLPTHLTQSHPRYYRWHRY